MRAALEAGVEVTVLPGPSAVETALVASGLVAEQYRFLGFLPRGEKRLAAVWEELGTWPWPAVAFESPQRLPASLRALASSQPNRVAAVCRELGVSEATYHRWRNQFGGLKAEDAKKLKDLERENATLKRLLADAEWEKDALREIAKGNF